MHPDIHDATSQSVIGKRRRRWTVRDSSQDPTAKNANRDGLSRSHGVDGQRTTEGIPDYERAPGGYGCHVSLRQYHVVRVADAIYPTCSIWAYEESISRAITISRE